MSQTHSELGPVYAGYLAPGIEGQRQESEPIGLNLAQLRMERKAVRGAFCNGRYRCPFYVWGLGPPLVIVPGMATDARSFVLLIAHLAEHFTCIAYDFPAGQGDGARLARYSHPDLVADVFALLDHLGMDESFILGYSFGSTVALGALCARPERLPRAVILNGFARRPLAPAEIFIARLARHWQAPMKVLPFRDDLLSRSHYGPFADRPPEIWQFFLDRCGADPIAAVAHRALLLHSLDLRPELAGIHQPVLLITGEDDPIVHRSCGEELVRMLPNVTHVELCRCGHYGLFTHPGELAEVMRRFLKPPCVAS